MSKPWPIHTLVFDLDDTLYPECDFVRGGFDAAGFWLREAKGVEGFAAVTHCLFAGGRRGRIFNEALMLVGLEPCPELVTQLIAAYRQHEPCLTLFADAAEILDWASSRCQLALITDGYADVQKRKICALGLASRIECRIITDDLGGKFWKPSPEPFRQVMTKLVGCPEGYLYVGDNAHKDFLGARSLGWRTVRIQRPQGEHFLYRGTANEAADCEIDSLLDLRGLIELK